MSFLNSAPPILSNANNIFLIGMPGSGKTTFGKALAKRLDLTFVDADQELIKRTGVSIATIFEIEGEASFRHREKELLAELVQRKDILLSTGGGIILAPENRLALRKNGTVIYLKAGLHELWMRTRRDTQRPLLSGPDHHAKLKALLDARDDIYAAVAHTTLDGGKLNVNAMADVIIDSIALRHAQQAANPNKIEGDHATG